MKRLIQKDMLKSVSGGFTLIELLVVIAIIAVLAGALLIAINPQSMIQKGRDATRLQDMDSLVKGISLALADGEILLVDTAACTDCSSDSGTRSLNGTDGWVKFTITTDQAGVPKPGLAKFISTLPADPLNATPNIYSFGSDGTNFEVNATLEHADNALKLSTDGGNSLTLYEVGTSLTIL